MDSNNKINQNSITITTTDSSGTQNTNNKSGHMDATDKTVTQHAAKKNIRETECPQNNSSQSIKTRFTKDESNHNDLIDEEDDWLSTSSFDNVIIQIDGLHSPTITTKERLKKHSFLWVTAKKIMRFFRSLSLKNNPANLTLRDFNKMPKELIRKIDDTKIRDLLNNYNKKRNNLYIANRQVNVHVINSTKKELLQLSQEIFETAKDSANKTKKYLSDDINSLQNKKEKNNLLEIMKSKIGFNPERFTKNFPPVNPSTKTDSNT